MAAAALLAAQRRARDQACDRDDARRAPRRRVERLAAGDPRIHLAPQRIQHGERAAQSFAIAKQADLAPHQILHFRNRDGAPALVGRLAPAVTCRVELDDLLRLDRPLARRIVAHRTPGAGAEDETLEQRIARQPVGAVHAGAGDLARRVQTRNRGAPVDVGLHAAHDVVGRRPDRDAIAREIQPRAPARLGDQRESASARTPGRDAPSTGRRRRCVRSRGRCRATRDRATPGPPPPRSGS